MLTPRRVLLVNPVPLFGGNRVAGASRLQPRLVSIYSFLAGHGVPIDVLDLHRELGVPSSPAYVLTIAAESARRVLAHDYDLLAISCNSSFHYLGAMDLAEKVRMADSKLTIVVGGCHATAAPDDFIAPRSPFDVVVKGEGELALLELARSHQPRPPSRRFDRDALCHSMRSG
jgi:hypothetical protein